MTNAIRPHTVKIIGLDPGLRRLGWGVIVCEGSRLSWVAHGVIAPGENAAFRLSACCICWTALEAIIAAARARTKPPWRRCSST